LSSDIPHILAIRPYVFPVQHQHPHLLAHCRAMSALCANATPASQPCPVQGAGELLEMRIPNQKLCIVVDLNACCQPPVCGACCEYQSMYNLLVSEPALYTPVHLYSYTYICACGSLQVAELP
jgi:hypothetical protein